MIFFFYTRLMDLILYILNLLFVLIITTVLKSTAVFKLCFIAVKVTSYYSAVSDINREKLLHLSSRLFAELPIVILCVRKAPYKQQPQRSGKQANMAA